MGKKRGDAAAVAAAAPAAAPKPLSHYAHALIPPFKSKDDLTKALKVKERWLEGRKELNASSRRRRGILLE